MASNSGTWTWNPIAAPTDVSGIANIGINALSKAGTAAGELRDSILQEEQRQWDNKQKEKEFAEKQYEFDQTYGLDLDKFYENMHQFDTKLAEDQYQFDQTLENAKAEAEYRKGMLAIQQAQEARAAEEYKKKLELEKYNQEFIKQNAADQAARTVLQKDLSKFNADNQALIESGEDPAVITASDNPASLGYRRQQLSDSIKANPYSTLTPLQSYNKRAAEFAAKTGYMPLDVSKSLTGDALTSAATEADAIATQTQNRKDLENYVSSGKFDEELAGEIRRLTDEGLIDDNTANALRSTWPSINDLSHKYRIAFLKSIGKEQKTGLTKLWNSIVGNGNRIDTDKLMKAAQNYIALKQMGGVNLSPTGNISEYDIFSGKQKPNTASEALQKMRELYEKNSDKTSEENSNIKINDSSVLKTDDKFKSNNIDTSSFDNYSPLELKDHLKQYSSSLIKLAKEHTGLSSKDESDFSFEDDKKVASWLKTYKETDFASKLNNNDSDSRLIKYYLEPGNSIGTAGATTTNATPLYNLLLKHKNSIDKDQYKALMDLFSSTKDYGIWFNNGNVSLSKSAASISKDNVNKILSDPSLRAIVAKLLRSNEGK